MNGSSFLNHTYSIAFEEINPNMRFSFYAMPFTNNFHGIIGYGMMNYLQTKIDLQNNFAIMNRNLFYLNSPSDYLLFEQPLAYVNTISIEQPQFRLNHLNSEEKNLITRTLEKFDDIFYHKGDSLTFTNEIKHHIRTKHEDPIYSKLYRYPQKYKDEVNTQIEDMLKQGIIRHSQSSYSAPIWIIPKRLDASGQSKFRIVTDFRKLNDITTPDKYPIPNIDEIIDKMGGAKYFSTLDLAKGFNQIEVAPADIPKTAFSTSSGHYEWLRMPFGLCNAPATFQRLMNYVLREHIGKICFVYLDDIIIFSTSLQEHIQAIEEIFTSLRKANLKVQLDKSEFLKTETEYLGHIISDKGVRPNPKKTDAIKNYNIPKTQKQIRQFLGICGFYRKFIRDFSAIARPISKYLKKDSKVNIKDPYYVEAFNKLKVLLTSEPILAYPDFEKEFVLTTDASNNAIGAVLSQGGHPICYASRTLNQHEIFYATYERELLAIVWATKYFRPYLYGRRFKIMTDHMPIKFIHNTKIASSRVIRWKIQLSEFDYYIEYIKGKDNHVADALSRPVNVITRAQRKLMTDDHSPPQPIRQDIPSRITRSKTRNDAYESTEMNGIKYSDDNVHTDGQDTSSRIIDNKISDDACNPTAKDSLKHGEEMETHTDGHDILSRNFDIDIIIDACNTANEKGSYKNRAKRAREQTLKNDLSNTKKPKRQMGNTHTINNGKIPQTPCEDIQTLMDITSESEVGQLNPLQTINKDVYEAITPHSNKTGSINNDSVIATCSDNTCHSADEDSSQLIQITERPINVFDNQFYFKRDKEENINTFYRHKKKVTSFITPHFSTEYFTKIIKEHFPSKGAAAVHFEDIRDFNLFQLTYAEIKSPNLPVRIFYATFELKEIKLLSELQEVILNERERSNHRGVDVTHHTLKYKIYWPNLKKEICKVINNCSICNLAKYDRIPLKLPFKETYTPNKCRELYQMDIWQLNTSQYYLTCIDVFSKFAQVYKIEGRTWIDAKRALIKIFNDMGKPIQLKTDLDPGLRSANLSNWLMKEDIQLILTSSKTGISDIERFHGSLNEHIRILKNRTDVDGLDLVETALYYYNTTHHSSIEDVPQRVHLNNINVKDALTRNKEKRLKNANKKRNEVAINPNYLTRPRVRKLDNPKRLINKCNKLDADHYEEERKNKVKCVHYKTNFSRRKHHQDV